jgi:hypothetical protein
MDDRYGSDVLAQGWRERGAKVAVDVPAEKDLVVEVADGFCGAVTRIEGGQVELEDYRGRRRLFPMGAGFMIDGEPVRLVHPARAGTAGARRSAPPRDPSRSTIPCAHRAAEPDPRRAGTTPSSWRRSGGTICAPRASSWSTCRSRPAGGLLAAAPPRRDRRYGVLVDHLVPGSKETRIVEQIMRGPHGAHLRIVGHPYIDVWQCVTPTAMGIRAWPGSRAARNGRPGSAAPRLAGRSQADIAHAWKRILSREQLPRPGPVAARPRRGAHRLRDGAGHGRPGGGR